MNIINPSLIENLGRTEDTKLPEIFEPNDWITAGGQVLFSLDCVPDEL